MKNNTSLQIKKEKQKEKQKEKHIVTIQRSRFFVCVEIEKGRIHYFGIKNKQQNTGKKLEIFSYLVKQDEHS